MKNLIRDLSLKGLNLTIVFLMAFWGVAIASEWYESMESSGIDQSQSALKNISTNGSYAGHQDVQQAVTDIVDSVDREKVDREVSQISEKRAETKQDTSETRHESGLPHSIQMVPICP